jgi:predicted small secreted protein
MKVINSARYLALLGVAAFSIFGVGCATVEGVGEDVEDLGEEIEDEAEDARRRR